MKAAALTGGGFFLRLTVKEIEMGWLYKQDFGGRTDDLVRSAMTNSECKTECLDSAMDGSTWYGIIRQVDQMGIERLFMVIVLVDRSDGEFGYKDMDESEGPNEANAPLRMIDFMDKHKEPSNELAKDWRSRCRANWYAATTSRRTKQTARAGNAELNFGGQA